MRIEHNDWACDNCKGRAVECIACGYSGTREGYWRMEELHGHALQDEHGPAARALELIEMLPDTLESRVLIVDHLARHAIRAEREIARAVERLTA